MANLKFSEWTTPTLGGNLNTKGHGLVSDAGQDIPITPGGLGSVLFGGEISPVLDFDNSIFSFTAYEATTGSAHYAVGTKFLYEGSSRTDAYVNNVLAEVQLSGTANSPEARSLIASMRLTGSANCATQGMALEAIFSKDSTGSTQNGFGLVPEVTLKNGTVGTAAAVRPKLFMPVGSSGVSLTDGSLFWGKIQAQAGSATNLYGLNLSGWESGMSVGTSYGIYLDNTIGVGTTNWALYSLSTAPSLLSGDLTVTGILRAEGTIYGDEDDELSLYADTIVEGSLSTTGQLDVQNSATIREGLLVQGPSLGSLFWGKIQAQAGSATNLYGLNLSGWESGMSVGTAYAIFLDDTLSIGTNNWAIYSESTAPSLLSGRLNIGDSSLTPFTSGEPIFKATKSINVRNGWNPAYGVEFQSDWTPSGAVSDSPTVYGMHVEHSINGSNKVKSAYALNSAVNVSGTGSDAERIVGVNAFAGITSATGSADIAMGLEAGFGSFTDGALIDFGICGSFKFTAYPSVTTTIAYGVSINMNDQYGGGATVGSYTALNIYTTPTLAPSGDNYAIRVSSPAPSRFEGPVELTALPTSDPAVAGRLWNDGGTLKVSAG